jgi:cytochrome b pre-mRNA-processing protein 3
MIFQFFKRDKENPIARRLYEAIVAQARHPVFYADLHVPDSVMGRFDMIILHAILLFRRLKDQGEEADDLAQAVYDWMWKDIDRSIRELGVGDPSVPKRMKLLTGNYFARLEAYNKAFDTSSEDALKQAFKRFFNAETMTDTMRGKLAQYALSSEKSLQEQHISDILKGEVGWIAMNDYTTIPEVSHD